MTPARKMAWSSTITTDGVLIGRRPHRQLDLRAVARIAADLGLPAVSLHAPDYRLADAAAIGRDGLGIEAGPAIVDEDPRAALLDLGVEAHRSPVRRELGGVGERLAARRDERLEPLVELRVADDHRLDRRAVRVLDVGGGRAERVGEALVRPARLGVGEPFAQLPLLAACQPSDLLGVVGALLDQREGLEDRVVEVRGHVRALIRPGARHPLGSRGG